MTKHILTSILTIVCVTACFGQHSWRFRSDNYVGLSIGEMGSYGQGQTVNGLSAGPWFVGLGAGLDYYRFRSVPLFLSVSHDLLSGRRNALFLILNGGVDLPWYKRDLLAYQDMSSAFRPGLYWATGLGYRWRFSEASHKALLLSATYGSGKLTERQTIKGGCYDPPTCAVNSETDTYDYTNRTVHLGIGVEF